MGEMERISCGGAGNDELRRDNGAYKFHCGAGTDKIIDFNQSQDDIKANDCEQY
jgi:hypothetical protein